MKPIEQMTIAEVRQLKEQLASSISEVITQKLNEFEKEYGIVAEVTGAYTECEVFRFTDGHKIKRPSIRTRVTLQGELTDDD